MKKERFPQEIFWPANSIIALNRQNKGDPRLDKYSIQLSEHLEKHPEEMRTRVEGYIASKSRVTAGGDS